MTDNSKRCSAVVAALLIVCCTIMLYIAQLSPSHILKPIVTELNPSSKPLCSFRLISEIVRSRQDGFVAGTGVWSRRNNGVIDRFHPSICRFRHGFNLPPVELVQCLQSQLYSARSVVLAGDSNSNRYYAAFRWLMESAGAKCQIIKTDKSRYHQIDPSYYNYNRAPLIVHDRDCSGCTNEKMRCKIANRSITIERLALEFTNDAEVTSFLTYRSCTAKRVSFSPCPVSTSTQQFLLKDYLASTPPDLIIVFGNAHDSYRFTLREHAMNVRTFADMLDIYLPPSTKVIWTSKSSEYERRKPATFRGRIYESRTMNIAQWLRAANKIQYQEMRNRMLAKNSPLMFFDLQEMSEPVLADWNLDGVHMNPAWYHHIISYLMQTLCMG